MDTDTNSNYPESPTEEDEVFLCKGCGEVRLTISVVCLQLD